MIKFLFPRAVLLALTVSCICGLSASGDSSSSAQGTPPATTQVTPTSTAPAKSTQAIGAAPANSNQSKILSTALSPKTRQTLQAAMDSLADDSSARSSK